MAIHIPSLADPRPRQPSPLVPRRPLQIRLPPLGGRRPRRYSYRLWGEPRNSTVARGSLTAGRNDECIV